MLRTGTRKKNKKGKDLRLALYDIPRAHFYGEAQREIYVTLPPGDEQEGYCAILISHSKGPGAGLSSQIRTAQGWEPGSQEGVSSSKGIPSKGSQVRNSFPSKVPRNRFPSKVPKRFPQARFPGRGSQARFPGTGCQEQVPKQGS